MTSQPEDLRALYATRPSRACPSGPNLVRMYLRLPIAWRVIGAQAFMVGRPNVSAAR